MRGSLAILNVMGTVVRRYWLWEFYNELIFSHKGVEIPEGRYTKSSPVNGKLNILKIMHKNR